MGIGDWGAHLGKKKTNSIRIHLNYALKNKYFQCMMYIGVLILPFLFARKKSLTYLFPANNIRSNRAGGAQCSLYCRCPFLVPPPPYIGAPTIWIACWVDHLTKHFVAMARYHFSIRNMWWSLYLTLLVRKGNQTIGDSTTAGAPFIALMFLL